MFMTGGYSNTMLPITTESMPKFWTSMESLRETTYIDIITGKKSVDDFDAFVEQWNKMGGEQITKEANEWYHSL
jgi:putative aldouronate transport system substrate-binding protein